jgi:signal transduction histidine kinase
VDVPFGPKYVSTTVRSPACLCNSAEFAPLALVYEDSREELHGDLQEALRTGLVLHSEGTYRFLHDRVQEAAANSLIPETLRAEAHLRIGSLLAEHTRAEKWEEGDCVQVQQVVLNLTLNAVEALSSVDEGVRELLICTEQNRTNGVLVAVRDSGPGIDPERIERVFDAFYTTKSSGVGWGCQSVGRSSTPTGVGCGQTQTRLEALYFVSPCPARQ